MSVTGRTFSRRQDGFTLLEALVSLTIMGLISGLVFPSVTQGVKAAAFQQAASGLRADLLMARAQARRTGQPVELVVQQAGEGYGWTPGPQRGLIAGVSLSPAGGQVSFYPDGSSSGGALALGQGRRQARITVDPLTGLAEDAT